MSGDFPGEVKINIRRRLDGAVRVESPPIFVISPENAVKLAQALLKEAGVDLVMAEPGQTVIKPPKRIVETPKQRASFPHGS